MPLATAARRSELPPPPSFADWSHRRHPVSGRLEPPPRGLWSSARQPPIGAAAAREACSRASPVILTDYALQWAAEHKGEKNKNEWEVAVGHVAAADEAARPIVKAYNSSPPSSSSSRRQASDATSNSVRLQATPSPAGTPPLQVNTI